MMPEDQRNDSETLAGEYVLGTLEEREREDFERRMVNDARLQEEVETWQHRLAPLLEGIEPVMPPDSVWEGVESRLALESESTQSPLGGIWESLSFWRNLGMVTASMVLVLGLMLMTGQPGSGMSSVLVVMNDQNRAGWLVAGRANHGFVNVSAMEPTQLANGKVCQLWMEDRHGNWHPIGLLPHDGRREMPLPMMPKADNAFKVSVEDMDQMPRDKPSNDIVFEGKLTEI
jgi:anti-sigma-K factor RskA